MAVLQLPSHEGAEGICRMRVVLVGRAHWKRKRRVTCSSPSWVGRGSPLILSPGPVVVAWHLSHKVRATLVTGRIEANWWDGRSLSNPAAALSCPVWRSLFGAWMAQVA